ncbi:hypothetical protein ACEPAF_1971 [Sanghuangporus sanghuang]
MLPALHIFPLASSVISEHIPVRQDARQYDSTPLSSFFSSLLSFVSFPSNSTELHNDTYGAVGSDLHTRTHTFARREIEHGSGEFIAFACLIPVLVVLSGIFAGLTLGYMSLDETQLNVLSISGTPKQREYANKIKPIRKNGHLLLVTLLLANMITNETLPVISDPILGGGVQSVVVSTTLIVLFAEIIPQSICTRHGLYVGAKCAGVVRVLIWIFGIIAWPVAKLLEFLLGPHHGIIYRRAELKELIALHGAENPLGGDLQNDTVTIIGATLDLQDKTVKHAMTPISRAFMLHIDAKLDYDTLRRICATGHSRIPVYEEVELTVPIHVAVTAGEMGFGDGSQVPAPAKKSIDGESLVKTKAKKIIGVLLVKHCVLLDPEDAVPVRKMRLIKVPFVPQNEPLLGILDRFQEGRSHMAIVSRLSVERAQSVKKEVRKGLTQRLLGALHGDSSASDSSSESSDSEDENELSHASTNVEGREQTISDDTATAAGEESLKESVKVKFAKSSRFSKRNKKRRKHMRRGSGHSEPSDLEKGDPDAEAKRQKEREGEKERMHKSALEQRFPADAVLSKENAEEYLATQGIDPAIMPLGIITLEDVLEELIGEEIYDEFDIEGTGAHSQSFLPPGAHPHQQQSTKPGLVRKSSAPELATNDTSNTHIGESLPMSPPPAGQTPGRVSLGLAMPRPIALTSLRSLGGLLRSRSAPPTPKDAVKPLPGTDSEGATPPHAMTPAPNVGGSRSVDGEYLSIITTSPEGNTPQQGRGGILPQIIESPSGSEGVSPPSYAPIPEKQQSLESQTKGQSQSQSQAKSPSPPVSYPFPNPAVAAVAAGSGTGATSPSTTPKSRSASPAPSLEAAILHSKRRRSGIGAGGPSGSLSPSEGNIVPGFSSAGGTVSGIGIGGASASGERDQRGRVKGAFKSSPLASVGLDASVVVADEIRKEREREKREREETGRKEQKEKGPE